MSKVKARSGKAAQADRVLLRTTVPPGLWNFVMAFALLVSALLVLAGLYAYPNFHSFLPEGSWLDHHLTRPNLLPIGFIGLVLFFRFLPLPSGPGTDVSKMTANLWLALFTGLCFFSRFYRPEDPAPYYWVDHIIVTGDIRNIIDYHKFELIHTYSSRPTFFSYFTALLWTLFPGASGVLITRLSCTLIDLGTLWGLYLLGRTIRGRRLGLILAALWSMSMPATIWAYTGSYTNPTLLACAWVMVFFFRLVQKPVLRRFIYWGVALAFGDYTYAPFRPWAPVMVVVTILWVLFSRSDKRIGLGSWFLALGLSASWAFLFFYKNSFLPPGMALMFHSPILPLVGLLLLAFYAWCWWESREGQADPRVFRWATGVGVAGLLMAPMQLSPIYSAHSTASSLFHITGQLSLGPEVLKPLWDNIQFFIGAMFNRADLNVIYYPPFGHSYFECFPEFAMVIGAAYFIARPSWAKVLVVGMAVVGAVPFVFSMFYGTNMERVFGAIVPLLLLAGWGLDGLWDSLKQGFKRKHILEAVFLMLFTLWALDARAGFDVAQRWLSARTTGDSVIGAQVDQDWKDHHVIVAPYPVYFVDVPFTMLCDQKDAWLLNDPNPLYLGPGEKGKDIVLLTYVGDGALNARIRNEFPQAQWTAFPNWAKADFMNRILIPFDSLEEKPGKLFYIQRVPQGYWHRLFYWPQYPYGIARGIVGWEDRVENLEAPFPSAGHTNITARADGEWTVQEEGNYQLSTDYSGEKIILAIDGKKVIDELQAPPLKVRIHLSPGPHHVTYWTTFRQHPDFTHILVSPPGGGALWTLGTEVPGTKP